jgi:lipid-binding SYLF domain-containing protein
MGLAASLVMGTVLSAELSSEEVKRLTSAAEVLRDLSGAPDKNIAADAWNNADCVAVIPGVKKAAFILGGEFGRGVLSCRSGSEWSAPIFLALEKGSAGFQIGAEQVDLVLLIMNQKGVDKMLDNKVNLGADASVAAGPVGRTASASTDGRLTAEILAYSRSKGAFAGINVSGGALRPDKDANTNAYGSSAVTRDVLFKNSKPAPAAANEFMAALHQESVTLGKK